MARRKYITQDKHLAQQIRKLVRDHGLRITRDGGDHTRLIAPDGTIVGTISTTQFSGPASIKALAQIRAKLEKHNADR